MRRVLIALLLLPLLAACGTMSHGPLQRIRVETDPAGAVVRTTGCGTPDTQFVAPGKFWASRRSTHCTLHFTADGYVPFAFTLNRIHAPRNDEELEGLGVGEIRHPMDIVFALAVYGIIELGSTTIDWASGGLYALTPNDFLVELEPVAEAPFQD